MGENVVEGGRAVVKGTPVELAIARFLGVWLTDVIIGMRSEILAGRIPREFAPSVGRQNRDE